MSYCPECCSEEYDDVKRGNKRFFICEICGAEWIEEEAGQKTCQSEKELSIRAKHQMVELQHHPH